MNLPTLLELLKAGVHFGHRTSRWHPKMQPYIYGTKDTVHVIDLNQTRQKLEEAAQAAAKMAGEGKIILFIGTKEQASNLVAQEAQFCRMPYIHKRWIGGLFTNFFEVIKGARKLTQLKNQRASGELKKYTKKEQLEFDREISRLEEMYGGIEQLYKLPDAIFIIDCKHEETALREAKMLKIPILAICDTNADPSGIKYPIPANDDALKSLFLIIHTLAEAIKEGKESPVEPAVEQESQQEEVKEIS